jgi:hypothetical protein
LILNYKLEMRSNNIAQPGLSHRPGPQRYLFQAN